jgi:hypothetical protein
MLPSFVGGSKSERQWRNEFGASGLPIREPRVADVEVGIQRGYSLFKQVRMFVLDNCVDFIGDIQAYSRKLDDLGNPTEDIADKSTWHRMDAYRYMCIPLADVRRVGVVL